MTQDLRIFAPATERNKDVIADILLPRLNKGARVLEIASGSGEHGVHFCTLRPDIIWHPSNLEAEHIHSVDSWRQHTKLDNLKPCSPLDVLGDPWHTGHDAEFDAIFNANMIHISPWSVTTGLFKGAAQHLQSGGRLFLYGPYRVNGDHTAPSNVEFDKWLKAKNPEFGVRDIEAVVDIAAQHGLEHLQSIAMPANNFIQIFTR